MFCHGLVAYSGDLNNALDSAQKAYSNAKAIYALLEKEGRIISKFNPNLPVNLPLGISKTIGNNKMVVALDSVYYSPGGGRLSAYLLAKFPLTSDSVGFFAKDIDFNKGGITGGKLSLIGDKKIDIFPNTASLTIVGKNNKSYIVFDCDGYKSASLDCELEFSNSVFKPVNNPSGKITASFTIALNNGFDDFMISNVGLSDKFEISNLKGFTFQVTSLAYDNSSTTNPSGMVFPDSYDGAKGPDWKGFYAPTASITFPPEFKDDAGNPITLTLHNFIIDQFGISGYVEGQNLIANGDMAGWGYTIDDLKIGFSKNVPKVFDVAGKLTIPVFDTTTFKYEAQVDAGGDMFFSVKLDEERKYDLKALSSKLTLFRNSYIEVKRENGKITPKAVFNGELRVQNSDIKVDIANIVFSNMVITANPFSFDIDKFALRGKFQSKMRGFPITLHDIALIKDGEKVGLDASMLLNFAPATDKGFSADAGFRITADIDLPNGKLSNPSVNLKKIYVEADMGFLNFKGEIESFDQDATYGNGFRGMLDANFKPGIGVKASAYFGNINNYRYWYVDAMVTLPTPVMVFPGLGFYGFGGGGYYHMTRRGTDVRLPTTTEAKTSLESAVGASSSGTQYIPDRNTLFGCKATVEFGTVSTRKAFNGNGTLEFAFDKEGLSSVGLYAKAYFITDIEKRSQASVYAEFESLMDINNWSFTASLETFINVGGIIKGTGTNNSAGTAYMKFSKDRWYIYIGQPAVGKRISVEMAGVGVEAYFVIGDSIPAMPSISELIPDYHGSMAGSQRDLSALSGGAGFAFGAKLAFEENYKLWRIRLDAAAAVGFDIMLKNVGRSTHCEGRSGTVGINGWYAMGQAYVWAEGGLSFDAGWWGDYDLARLSASLILKAELPNPTYVAGSVEVEFDVCGGLFSGSFDFTLEFGDKCKVAGEKELAQAAIIKSVEPTNGTDDVPITSNIVVNFNQPVGIDFTLKGNTFKIDTTELKLTEGNNIVAFESSFDEKNKTMTIVPKSILSPNTSYKLSIMLGLKRKLPGMESYSPVIENNLEVSESRIIDFHTGKQTKIEILANNIAYSYPLPLQGNVYKNDFDSGYISLKKPQMELLKKPANFSGDTWKQQVRFTSTSGTTLMSDLNVTNEGNYFSFKLPSTLIAKTVYKMELVYTEILSAEDIALNKVPNEAVIYSSWFRISMFPTFSNKINAFTHDLILSPDIDGKTMVLSERFKGKEFFDLYEIGAGEKLVTCKFDTTNDAWLRDLYPLFYNLYGPKRMPEFAPLSFNLEGGAPAMSEEDARLGVFSFTNGYLDLIFKGDKVCYDDYLNAIASSGVLLPAYKNIGKSGHKVIFSYYLPGRKDPIIQVPYNLK